jgi:hypothetical protein
MSIKSKVKPQIHFAFGTRPNFHPPPFSEVSHLVETDRPFALFLANIEVPEKPIKIRENVDPSSPPPADILKDLPQPEEGVKPCLRLDCKEVIRQILTSNKRNRAERDDISYESMILGRELEENIQVSLSKEGILKEMATESDSLSFKLKDVKESLMKMSEKKSALDQERDELNNKVTAYDSIYVINVHASNF